MTGLVLAFLLPASVAPKLMGVAAATDSLVALGWAIVLPVFGMIFFWRAEATYGRN